MSRQRRSWKICLLGLLARPIPVISCVLSIRIVAAASAASHTVAAFSLEDRSSISRISCGFGAGSICLSVVLRAVPLTAANSAAMLAIAVLTAALISAGRVRFLAAAAYSAAMLTTILAAALVTAARVRFLAATAYSAATLTTILAASLGAATGICLLPTTAYSAAALTAIVLTAALVTAATGICLLPTTSCCSRVGAPARVASGVSLLTARSYCAAVLTATGFTRAGM